MLACCVCARLWQSTIDRNVLLQRVICITFGQPFLHVKIAEDEIKICPKFEKSIHSVFNKDDHVPLMIGCFDLVAPQASVVKALGMSSADLPKFNQGEHHTQSVRFL